VDKYGAASSQLNAANIQVTGDEGINPGSKILIQECEKYYFIKARCQGTMQNQYFLDTARANLAQNRSTNEGY
jgi:hypothetical protein